MHAFRHALQYRAETWYDGTGQDHKGLTLVLPRGRYVVKNTLVGQGLRAYFRSDLTEGQRSSRGQDALEMSYDHH